MDLEDDLDTQIRFRFSSADMDAFALAEPNSTSPERAAALPPAPERMTPHLAAIVEQSEDAIISSTLDGIVLSWNQGATKVYGYTPEEALGRSVSMLFPPEQLPELEGLLESIRQGNAVSQRNTERVRKDGSRLQVSVSLSPIKDDF